MVLLGLIDGTRGGLCERHRVKSVGGRRQLVTRIADEQRFEGDDGPLFSLGIHR